MSAEKKQRPKEYQKELLQDKKISISQWIK